MRKWWLVAALVLVGCGGDGPLMSTTPALEGTWLSQNSASCGTFFVFHGASYRRGSLCLEAGSTSTADADFEDGSFSLSPGRIDMSPVAATCAARAHPKVYVGYELLQGDLVVTFSTSIVSFVAASTEPGTGTGATLRTGCFADDGTFTVAPLTAL